MGTKEITSFLTLEKQLARFQDEDPVYKHLYAAWQTAKDDLSNILRNVVIVFPHYSRHDASHAETIIRRVEAVLGSERISKLYPTEIWLFLMSAYTHDLGMLITDEDVRKLWKSSKFSEYLKSIADGNSDLKDYANAIVKQEQHKEMPNDWPVSVKWAVIYLTADYIRKNHPERSLDMIDANRNVPSIFRFDFSFQYFIPERLIHLLGVIDALHGRNFEDIFDLDYCCQGIGLADDLVFPRRIATMLRLGDLLDMDNNRFDKNAYSINGKVPETTLFHQKKEASLWHFLVTENRIEASFNCPDEGSYEAASSWMTWLHDEVTNLALNWNDIVSRDFGSAPVLKQSSITLNGKKLKGNSLRHFDFSNDELFEIMEGANIYKNQFSCLRELIQNAEDATKLRLWEDIQSGEIYLDSDIKDKSDIRPFDISTEIYNKYKIQITLSYYKESQTYRVSVRDHGIGITDERLEQMEQVASSWHNKSAIKMKYKNMPKWLAPTGTFGLGLQSVFRLTDILECETAPRREEAKKIIFRSKNKGGSITSQPMNEKEIYPEGSVFRFDFSRKAFEHFNYQLGGVYDNKLRDADPFLDQNSDTDYLNLYYLVECIYQDVSNGYFPIEIKLVYGDTDVGQIIPILRQDVHLLKGKDTFENITIRWDANKNQILAYEAKHCIYYHLYFPKITKNTYHFSNANFMITFRGMRVKDRNMVVMGSPYDSLISGAIYLDGFPTKEWLTLNREEIRREQLNKLQDILRNDLYVILKYIYQKILEAKEGGQTLLKPDSAIALMALLEWVIRYKDYNGPNIKDVKYTLASYLDFEGPCMIAKGDTLIPDKRTWKEMFETMRSGKDIWVYDLGDRVQFGRNDQTALSNVAHLFEEKVLNKGTNDPLLLPAYAFYALFDDTIPELKEVYGRATGEILYHYGKRSEKFHIAVVNQAVANSINSQLLDYPRIITCAMPEYRALAITGFPVVLNGTFFRIRRPHNYRYAPFMITPFSKADLEYVERNKTNAEVMWQEISRREDFERLVKYVKNNNVDPKVTELKIKEDYHRWTKDIFATYGATHGNDKVD